MKDWLRGKRGGLLTCGLIAVLVAGGLGWATAAALRLEREQQAAQVDNERAAQLRVALWRLDSRVSPLVAREDHRPFNHYSTVYAPPLMFHNYLGNSVCAYGSVLEPSPLLHAELPDWMRLHFQVDCTSGWESPQVPSATMLQCIQKGESIATFNNVTAERRELLRRMARALPANRLLTLANARATPTQLEPRHAESSPVPPPSDNRDNNLLQKQQQPAPNQALNAANANDEYQVRADTQQKIQGSVGRYHRMPRDNIYNNLERNGEKWLDQNRRDLMGPPEKEENTASKSSGTPSTSPLSINRKKEALGLEVEVNLGPMVSLWAPTDNAEELLLVRLIRIEDREICQGVLLDADRLREILTDEVRDLFPEARLLAVHDATPTQPERTMTALPLELDPGPAPAPADPGWTPLRVGLGFAWVAALIALGAVALGGWSLLDLSERRIRFVSAVTHELRTPLTTLRLYLDMLLNGLVRDEKQREEYLHTLNAEADRLNRLVGNVLDFSRLERQRPRLERAAVNVAGLVEQLRNTWQRRCADAEKELIVENALEPETILWTDGDLVQQILGNLLDNACKYSRGADDQRLWLRVRRKETGIYLDVEDRGAGVPPRERRAIFRAFRRGRGVEATAGGVGLGLALARRWAQLLGGRLSLLPPSLEGGACFRLELPVE
jgi:two-component sensor histidine kinase